MQHAGEAINLDRTGFRYLQGQNIGHKKGAAERRQEFAEGATTRL